MLLVGFVFSPFVVRLIIIIKLAMPKWQISSLRNNANSITATITIGIMI
jgi:hypothetical protein